MTSAQTSFPTKHLVTLPGLGPQHSFLGDTVQPTVLNVRTICRTPVIPQNPLLTKRRAPSPTDVRVHDLPSRQVSGAQTQDDYWQAWTRGRTDHGRWGEDQNEPGICLSHSKGQTPPTQLHTRSSYLFARLATDAGHTPVYAWRRTGRGSAVRGGLSPEPWNSASSVPEPRGAPRPRPSHAGRRPSQEDQAQPGLTTAGLATLLL